MSLPIARYNIYVGDYFGDGSYELDKQESLNGNYCDYDEVKEYLDILESKLKDMEMLVEKLGEIYMRMDSLVS